MEVQIGPLSKKKELCLRRVPPSHVAMGQNSVPLVNIPIPTKIGKMGGAVHLPQKGTVGVDPQPCL